VWEAAYTQPVTLWCRVLDLSAWVPSRKFGHEHGYDWTTLGRLLDQTLEMSEAELAPWLVRLECAGIRRPQAEHIKTKVY
jgi:hypothetical protein